MRFPILLFVLVVSSLFLPPSVPLEARSGSEGELPVDPAVRVGHLDNGLTYYIRANARPENRVELRLAVNAGSILEEDDQQGLAHFLEHMAFNGTANFAPGELVSFLESIGSRFGPDLNAYTSFDETVYMLEIPTDKPGFLEKGMLVLSDWASAMTLDPVEVDKERGVVLEEWRLGQGAQERLRRQHWPVLFRDSRYAIRLPIGKPEVIESAPAGRLKDFYDRWYRPDLMAVLAVGDLDVDAMETLIRDHFSDLSRPVDPVERPAYDVPSHDEVLASSAVDPEQPYTQVWVAFKHPSREEGTLESYRAALVEGLLGNMLDARFGEITEKPDAPFQFAGSSPGSLVRGTDTFSLFAVARESEIERALTALMTEVARVREHGFRQGELDRARARYLAGIERAYNERDKAESGALISEYVRNFLTGEPIPGIEREYEMAGELVPAITLEDVNGAIDRLVHRDNTVILASGPEKEGLELPTPARLIELATATDRGATEAYEDEVAGVALMETLPEPGPVVQREELPELGITTVTLANGVVVWLKPTDFKNDQILFGSVAPGGASLADPGDYVSASNATAVVGEGGVGGFTPTEMQKLLAGKIVGVSPRIDDFTSGIGGSTRPEDLETALQAVYLFVTAPNRRPESFEVLLDRYRTFLQNRASSPEARFSDRVSRINYSDHYMFQPPTLEWLEQLDPDVALDFYRDTFADPANLRFLFVGNLDLETVIPLLERYLGSLPIVDDRPAEIRDPHIRFPEGTVRDTVRAGKEPKATTLITWPAALRWEEMELFTLRLASDILEIRLRELLREELGSTYGVNVGSSMFVPYRDYAVTQVSFGSSPENMDRMIEAVFAEIARFKTEGPSAEEVDKVQELERRSVETNLRENAYWLGSLRTTFLFDWPAERILHRLDRIDEVDAEGIRDTFSRFFPEDRHTVISLLPEIAIPADPGDGR